MEKGDYLNGPEKKIEQYLREVYERFHDNDSSCRIGFGGGVGYEVLWG